MEKYEGIYKLNQLKDLRLEKHLRLQDVSEATGLSKSLISRIENGSTTLTPKSSQILSDYYGIKIEPVEVIREFKSGTRLKDTHYHLLYKDTYYKLKILIAENKELKKKLNAIRELVG